METKKKAAKPEKKDKKPAKKRNLKGERKLAGIRTLVVPFK